VVAIDLCPRYVDTAAIGTPLFTIQVATLCRSCPGPKLCTPAALHAFLMALK